MGKKTHKPYKFQDVKHSVDGCIGILLEVVSILLILAELILTIQARGQAGGIVGFLGIAALLFSIMGFVFSIISWQDEEASDGSKRVGTLLGIIMVILNLILLLLGISG